jgi:hypothetical protein
MLVWVLQTFKIYHDHIATINNLVLSIFQGFIWYPRFKKLVSVWVFAQSPISPCYFLLQMSPCETNSNSQRLEPQDWLETIVLGKVFPGLRIYPRILSSNIREKHILLDRLLFKIQLWGPNVSMFLPPLTEKPQIVAWVYMGHGITDKLWKGISGRWDDNFWWAFLQFRDLTYKIHLQRFETHRIFSEIKSTIRYPEQPTEYAYWRVFPISHELFGLSSQQRFRNH